MRLLDPFNISNKVFSGFGIIMPVMDAWSHEQLVDLVRKLASGPDAGTPGPSQ